MANPSSGVMEYDPQDFLKSLGSSSGQTTKEYAPEDFLKSLTEPEKVSAPSASRVGVNALKGAEFFARNPVAPQITSFEPVKEIGKGVASVLDTTIGSAIPSTLGYITQAVARPFTTPAKAEELAQTVSSATDKPFGKAFGITEDPAYKAEATNRFMQFVGENMAKGADWISQKTGLPKEDVNHMMNSVAILAGHQAGTKVTPVVKNAYNDVVNQFEKAKSNLVKQPETVAGGAPGVVTGQPKAVEVIDPATGKPVGVAEQGPGLNPALAQKVAEIQQSGGTVNPDAVLRQNKALSVDPRLQLTEGQALQDPNLISVERNERGIKEQLVNKFNEQNQILKERAEIYKNEFTPDVKGLSYVENSTHAINAVDDIIKKNEEAAKTKYQELKDLGGGKLELNGQDFGKTTKAALSAEDIEDFVPSPIMKRIDAYADGKKQMNLNLFESLRTQIARESRKAERAGDGNTVHALSVVRNQLEQMPLANEAGAIKAVADEARAIFKANRDLEANNSFYGQASRGGLDSKDFVPKVAFRSKNDYFGQAMQILDADPIAKQNFAQGTMDYMIRESTDGSGNLNPMKMANYIDDLQLNGRLEPLFGKENAAKLLDYAEVSRYTKATPEGSFVNYSNTVPAGAGMIQKYGPAAAEVVGANLGVPFVGTVTKKGAEFMQKRKYTKQAQKATEFGAGVEKNSKGTKISDILKD